MTVLGKQIFVSLIAVFLLYNAIKWSWGEVAEVYFNYRCEQDAGEFIYHTVENVEGVFQMRPREKGEYFSRLRKGDLMEDPYGHTNIEVDYPWNLFLMYPKASETNYLYFESKQGPDLQKIKTLNFYNKKFVNKPIYEDKSYWHYKIEYLSNSENGRNKSTVLSAVQKNTLESKYGFTWRQVQNTYDKYFGVIGGEIIVMQLSTSKIIAIKRGFFFWPPWSKRGGICPIGKDSYSTYKFIIKVLKPATLKKVYKEVIQNGNI